MSELDQENICYYSARIAFLKNSKKEKNKYISFLENQITQTMQNRNAFERSFPAYLCLGFSKRYNLIAKHQKTIKQGLLHVEEFESEICRITKLRIKYAKRILSDADKANKELFEAQSSLKDIAEIVKIYISLIDSMPDSLHSILDSFYCDTRDYNFTSTKMLEIEFTSNVESLHSNTVLLISMIKTHNVKYGVCCGISANTENILFNPNLVKETRSTYLLTREELSVIEGFFKGIKREFAENVHNAIICTKEVVDNRVGELVFDLIEEHQK